MSRIGKQPVAVPAGVKVALTKGSIAVEGPLGKLNWSYRPEVAVEFDEAAKLLRITRADESRQSRALHGLSRALIQNMITGVTKGYEKKLEIVGVGYLAAVAKDILQ